MRFFNIFFSAKTKTNPKAYARYLHKFQLDRKNAKLLIAHFKGQCHSMLASTKTLQRPPSVNIRI